MPGDLTLFFSRRGASPKVPGKSPRSPQLRVFSLTPRDQGRLCFSLVLFLFVASSPPPPLFHGCDALQLGRAELARGVGVVNEVIMRYIGSVVGVASPQSELRVPTVVYRLFASGLLIPGVFITFRVPCVSSYIFQSIPPSPATLPSPAFPRKLR